MDNALIVVGENTRYNKPFMDYLYREVSKSFESIDIALFIDKNDHELFLHIQECVEKCSDIIIVASKKSFNLVSKIISTLTDDTLALKDEMLMPSKTVLYSKESYLLEFKNRSINVICTEETKTLPQILISSKQQTKFLNIIGIDEESCAILLEPIAQNYEIKITVTQIVDGWTLVKAHSYKYGQLAHFISAAKSLFPDKVIAGKDVVSHIISKLIAHDKKITCAESCTGGLLSSMIVKNPGASSVFKGGLITYANEIKEAWLGVSKETLKNYGAVSEICVREMLEGALNVTGCDFSMAVSGIAGPGGATESKPVGTVFVGARNKEAKVIVERLNLKGDRNYIQTQAALSALKLLLQVDKKIFFA